MMSKEVCGSGRCQFSDKARRWALVGMIYSTNSRLQQVKAEVAPFSVCGLSRSLQEEEEVKKSTATGICYEDGGK